MYLIVLSMPVCSPFQNNHNTPKGVSLDTLQLLISGHTNTWVRIHCILTSHILIHNIALNDALGTFTPVLHVILATKEQQPHFVFVDSMCLLVSQ